MEENETYKKTTMRIILDSTNIIKKIRGVECRAWVGYCNDSKVVCFVAAIVNNASAPDKEYIQQELLSIKPEYSMKDSEITELLNNIP